MRIIPTSDPPADDSPQKFWLFSSSFSSPIPTPSVSDDSDDLPPPPSLPLHPRKKRSRSLSRQKIKKPLGKIKVESQPQPPKEAKPKPKPKLKPLRRSTERWTAERYAKAEVMVMEVMRDKAKEIGGRIERRKLREEARKYIGDTGLLDHLLKHMCGKVVEEGGLRFMRGFTADGVMQYWLEPADVEDTRGKGNEGKCGAAELREEIGGLSERVEVLDRDVEEFRSMKECERSVWQECYEKLLKRNVKLEIEMEGMNSSFQGLKGGYQKLLKRNINLEMEMEGMNSSFKGLKEDFDGLQKRNVKLEKEMAGLSRSCQGLKDELLLLKKERLKEKENKSADIEMIEDSCEVCDNKIGDKKNEGKQLPEVHHSISPKASFCSPQLQRPYVQLPCRGRVFVKCVNGSQKSLGHLSSLPLESGQLSLTKPQCTRQSHYLSEV